MIYKIKESFWSLGDNFTISDDSGRPQFIVKGKVFSWGDDLSFQDTKENELARIKQKLLSFKPTYKIIQNDEVFAEVVKEWSWLKKRFTLDVPGPNDYTITGSFWEHEFEFERSGKTVAKVSKNIWNWTDSYGVEIMEDENIVPILCTCIVIDQVLHDDNSSAAV